jgi:hypothetical protein
MLNIETQPTSSINIHDDIATRGFALVSADMVEPLHRLRADWDTLRAEYPRLPADEYLPGGARYRYRSYDRFWFDPLSGDLRQLPHEDYFQPQDINAVTGGIIRKFAPLTPDIAENPFLHALIRWDFEQFPMRAIEWQYQTWQVDVHLIYVVAEPGIEAHPTPEGVHRDGAEFVTVHLAALDNATGGVVSIYDDDKQHLESFQLNHLMHSYLFEDAVLWHGVTPIVPADGVNKAARGILTFDYHFAPMLAKPE